jgi:two-component sensor histidine kinase/putative methionine-R-sulfoxide reductase with GAF domain
VDAQHILGKLREYQRTLEAVSRIGPEVLPPNRLMHHVAAQVSRVTHIERAKVMRYRAEKGDLLVEAGVGWKPGVVGHATLAVDHRSPAGRAYQTGAPVAIRDLSATNEYRLPDLLREHGIISLLNVPIMINGFTWGVLEIDNTAPTTFDEWDVGFLSILANVMGACLALHDAGAENIDALAERARQRARVNIAFRELQHRVKNNLQMIISLLSLKMRESSQEVAAKLNEVMSRIQAISLAHDLLSGGEETSRLDFGDYLNSLCANIDPRRPDLVIEVEAQSIHIPLDRAVPAGLVINELVTNCMKHAFGNNGGRIRVVFKSISNSSEACVSVEDDGRGMEIPPRKGLGLSLVEGLAQQIQGRVTFEKIEIGSRTVLCFPVAI